MYLEGFNLILIIVEIINYWHPLRKGSLQYECTAANCIYVDNLAKVMVGTLHHENMPIIWPP